MKEEIILNLKDLNENSTAEMLEPVFNSKCFNLCREEKIFNIGIIKSFESELTVYDITTIIDKFDTKLRDDENRAFDTREDDKRGLKPNEICLMLLSRDDIECEKFSELL